MSFAKHRLQHPEGVDPSLGPSSSWWLFGGLLGGDRHMGHRKGRHRGDVDLIAIFSPTITGGAGGSGTGARGGDVVNGTQLNFPPPSPPPFPCPPPHSPPPPPWGGSPQCPCQSPPPAASQPVALSSEPTHSHSTEPSSTAPSTEPSTTAPLTAPWAASSTAPPRRTRSSVRPPVNWAETNPFTSESLFLPFSS